MMTEIAKANEKRILVVDDEKDLLVVLCELLQHYGFEAKGFTDSSEALKEFRKNSSLYSLVITDLTMPGIQGDELAQEVLRVRPGLPVMLCSGYNQRLDEVRAKQIGIHTIMNKPFEFEDLIKSVGAVLDT